MKNAVIAFASVLAIATLACSSDDNSGSPGSPGGGACFASSLQFTQTNIDVYPGDSNIFVKFDVKNTSTKDFDVQKGDQIVELKLIITTTDSSKYEEVVPTINDLAAGKTTTLLIHGTYGGGKTYQSYTIEPICRRLAGT
ncbi:hypothetical protein [Pendulispora albinea]|uniref:Uncharacterized protein n=1 Tax=Pendulispora albinea TaxID=2741071 RepID=A0ABZ2M6U8_9BACT